MALVPGIKKEFVSINVNTDEISIAHITKQNNLFCLNAFEKVSSLSINENLILFNPTKTKLAIEKFLQKNKLTDACIIIGLNSHSCFNKILSHSDKDLTKNDIENIAPKEYIADFYKISDSHFYVSGIHPIVLFQYMNLSIQSKSNTIAITTDAMALAVGHKKISKADLSPAYSENFDDWLSILKKHFHEKEVPHVIKSKIAPDNLTLTTHIGLYILGSNLYEVH